MADNGRMVKLAELWERTSAKGTRYFSGLLGAAQVLMFDAGEQPHPTREGETVHVWKLLVQERDPDRRPQRSDAPVRGQSTWDASRDLPTGTTTVHRNPRSDPREQRIQELAAQFKPDDGPGF